MLESILVYTYKCRYVNFMGMPIIKLFPLFIQNMFVMKHIIVFANIPMV